MHNEPPKTRDGEARTFFGRRSGKGLHAGQRALYERMLPQVEIEQENTPLDPAVLFPGSTEQILEIGYGGGEHLARLAQEHPHTGFIGCEVFSGGIAKMLQFIDQQEITNVRLFTDDAIKLLPRLPDASLACVYLLYPDPWPKTRHHKRRFVSPLTISELVRVIRPGGRFRFATDIEDYANWTLAHVLREPALRFHPSSPGSWHDPFAGWESTRYEQKARREGRLKSFYFSFERR